MNGDADALALLEVEEVDLLQSLSAKGLAALVERRAALVQQKLAAGEPVYMPAD